MPARYTVRAWAAAWFSRSIKTRTFGRLRIPETGVANDQVNLHTWRPSDGLDNIVSLPSDRPTSAGAPLWLLVDTDDDAFKLDQIIDPKG